MIKFPFYYLSLLVLMSTTAIAQKGITFDKTVHNFGTLIEGDEAVARFTFTNTGTKPITLVNVHASCGCTTPKWTKTAVAPGEKGIVDAVYSSQGRAGNFNKTVTVNTDGDPQYVVLRITGKVDQSPFKMTSGNMKLEKAYMYMGDITVDDAVTQTIRLMNAGDKVLNFFPEKIKKAAHISVTLSKTTLQPNEEALMTLRFDATKIKDWGYSYGSFNLVTDDDIKPEKRIGYAAKIKENFAAMPEGAKHPTVIYEKERHNFGDIQQRSRVTTSFIIKNEGEATLYIRKTKASCGCTVSRPQSSVLKPGEQTTLDVTYSTGSRKGKQSKSITVITNDPKKDETILWIDANIIEPEKKEEEKKKE